MAKSNLQNLFVLAETAESSGNHAEAYDYYTKILEEDTTNPKAWFGKGKAAGWESTIANNRLSEMTAAFQKAIKYIPSEKKGQHIREASESIAELTEIMLVTLNNHLQEFISLDNTYSEYINQCLQIIRYLEEYNRAILALNNLETIDKHIPLNIHTVELLIDTCKYNLEGVSYNDKYTEEKITYILTTENKNIFKNRFIALILIAQKIDPDYKAPQIANSTNYIETCEPKINDENSYYIETDEATTSITWDKNDTACAITLIGLLIIILILAQ